MPDAAFGTTIEIVPVPALTSVNVNTKACDEPATTDVGASDTFTARIGADQAGTASPSHTTTITTTPTAALFGQRRRNAPSTHVLTTPHVAVLPGQPLWTLVKPAPWPRLQDEVQSTQRRVTYDNTSSVNSATARDETTAA